MATAKQKRAVENLIAQNGDNVGLAMRKAGYSARKSRTPKNLTESKGFKELIEDCGLTDQLILESLVFDIKRKPKNRIAELVLASKIKGLEKAQQLDVNGDIKISISKEIADKYDQV